MFRGLFTAVAVVASGILLAFLFNPPEAPARPGAHLFAGEVARLSSRFHARPVLRGEALPGNACEFYRRAARDFIQGEGRKGLALLEEGRRLPREEFEVWISVNRGAGSTVRRGTERFCSVLLMDPLRGYEAGAPEVGLSLGLASVMIETALEAWDDGKAGESAAILLDAARFGQDIARGGGTASRYFASRVELLALKWLLFLLGEGFDSASVLRSVLAEIRRLTAGVHPAVETLDVECALFLGELGRTEEGEIRLGDRFWAPMGRGEKERAGKDMMEWTRRARDIVRDGGWLDAGRCSTFMKELRAASPPPVGLFFPDIEVLAAQEKRVEVLRRAARIAAALRVHRKALGSYPEKLEELVPAFFRPVPGDPMSAGPFHYRRDGDGSAVLWSTGPDGDDDGGRAAPIDLFNDLDGDWVFPLWSAS